MTTTVRLSPGGTFEAPAGLVQVDWRTVGPEGGAVDLLVEQPDGRPAPGLQRLQPGRLVLLAVPGPVLLRAVSLDGGALPAGTRLALTLTVQQQGSTLAHLVLPERDVSGTVGDEQVRLEPAAPGTLRVTAAGERGPGESLPEEPEALRAAYAARRVGGVPRAREDRQRRVVVVLDLSASLLPHVRSGAVRSLLALGLGLAAVVGRDAVLPVLTAGRTPLRLPDLDENRLDGYAERAVVDHGVAVGGVVGPLLDGPLRHAGAATAVLHLTDAAPPDLAALRDGLGGRGPGSWHALVLAASTADAAHPVSAAQDELGALQALPPDGPLRWAGVSPGSGPGWLATRLADERLLDDLVARLGLVSGAGR